MRPDVCSLPRTGIAPKAGLADRPAVGERSDMGISLSLFFLAVGAILAWAVSAEASGIDINVVGVILMIVGAIGLVFSVIFWSSWGGFGAASARREGSTTVVEH